MIRLHTLTLLTSCPIVTWTPILGILLAFSLVMVDGMTSSYSCQWHLCTDPYSSICPGRHFAMDALFIFMVSILHVYDIQPPLGPDGKPQEVKPKINLDRAVS